MNNSMKYANFITLSNPTIHVAGLDKTHKTGDIFAGMHALTVITKDGFAGAQALINEAEEEKALAISREIERAIADTEEREKLRDLVRRALYEETPVIESGEYKRVA